MFACSDRFVIWLLDETNTTLSNNAGFVIADKSINAFHVQSVQVILDLAQYSINQEITQLKEESKIICTHSS